MIRVNFPEFWKLEIKTIVEDKRIEDLTEEEWEDLIEYVISEMESQLEEWVLDWLDANVGFE